MAFPNLNFAPLVLFNNSSYLLSNINLCYPIFEPLECEPRRQQLPATTIELRSLVKDKVYAQDAALRAQLDKLQWNIEDESVLWLVYGDMPLEKVRTFVCEALYFLCIRY